MTKGKLDNGFEFEIDEKQLNDMRYIELIRDAGDDPIKSLDLAEATLGVEQKERLYDFLQDEEGRVPPEAFYEALDEIFQKAGEEVKNS